MKRKLILFLTKLKNLFRKKTKIKSTPKKEFPLVTKFVNNPIMSPNKDSFWESEAVFNPGAVFYGGKIHIFYRALGGDGVSRIGYACSEDGLNFTERISYPVFIAQNKKELLAPFPHTSPARLVYDPSLYTSGGGWGGSEDPRCIVIGDTVYLTFNMFNGWESMRVAYVTIKGEDLLKKKWDWTPLKYLSRPGDRQKNWVLFPEKFDDKFAIFYNIDKGDATRVHISYVKELDMYKTPDQNEAPDVHKLPNHIVAWHNRTRSASAPPVKTKEGWLLFYHAMDKNDPNKYKLGVLLLDLKDPQKILYRSNSPILSPDEWYENDYKPGIIYANGIVVKDETIFIYYGGGDKHIAVAYAKLDELLYKLKNNKNIILKKKDIK